MQSCKTNDARDFVNKHHNDDFNQFANTGFILRTFDEGNPVVFVSTNLANAYNQGPYIITVDAKDKSIIKENKTLMGHDSSFVNRDEIMGLTNKFLNYEIRWLSVDTIGNVFIGLSNIEKPDLIRFSNLRYKTEEYSDWKHIQDMWYSLHNAQ